MICKCVHVIYRMRMIPVKDAADRQSGRQTAELNAVLKKAASLFFSGPVNFKA